MYTFISAAAPSRAPSVAASSSSFISPLRNHAINPPVNARQPKPCSMVLEQEDAPALESGAAFLSTTAAEKARNGTKQEKIKLEKDGSAMWTEVHELSQLLRDGKMTWEDLHLDDIDVRLKWAGLFHRRKRTPGRFMMRLKVPNGILNSKQLNYFADAVSPYGDEGVLDITTRQNIQLRGVPLDDASDICNGLYDIGLTSFMSGMDNVRNLVGSPIAGIDPQELIDTRQLCTDINDMITDSRRGRPELSNLPRKFNICVSGSRDDFAHTHINDIGFVPVAHAVTGEIGFNVVIGGFFSIKRNEMAVPMDVWMSPDRVVDFCESVLIWFRDNGDRSNRQSSRLMYMVDKLTMSGFRDTIETACGTTFERAQPEPADHVPRRNILGVHAQKQEGLSWVGASIPAGRFTPQDARDIANLADKYSAGEARITVEQNVIFPNVANESVDALLAEPLLQKFKPTPASFSANLVSCTGSQFCGIALIETKNRAIELCKRLDEELEVTKDVRIHFTGCPNSCGQAQVADIGLMGAPARKDGKAVEGVKVFLGGKVGEGPALGTTLDKKGIPADVDDLFPVIRDLVIEKYGAVPRVKA